MKLLRAFFLSLSLFLLICPTCRAQLVKPKIAVFDFRIIGGGVEGENSGAAAADWLLSAFAADGRFVAVERWQIDKVLEERFLGASTMVGDRMAVKIGRAIPANIVILGSVLRLESRVEVIARIIDVDRVKLKGEVSEKGAPEEDLRDLVNRLAKKIIRKSPRKGVIVDINGRTATINLGGQVGAEKGMRFMVYQRGGPVRDPDTGEIVDYRFYEIGRIELVEINEKTARGILIEEIFRGAVKKKHKVVEIREKAGSSSGTGPGDPQKKKTDTIAVFPWRLERKAFSIKTILSETCFRVIKNSRRLTLKASFYDHPYDNTVKKINSRELDAMEYRSHPAGRLEKGEVDEICGLGEKLGVDAVLLGKMSARKIWSDLLEFRNIHVYLVHVKTGRIFEEKIKSVRGYAGDVLPGVLQNVVEKYEKSEKSD
ncbi:MAG: hypothetical protein GY859_02540 [Desulfobacterales bacterium]|nr:hypothetical protein [Desulfobacterales bacterium]